MSETTTEVSGGSHPRRTLHFSSTAAITLPAGFFDDPDPLGIAEHWAEHWFGDEDDD